jgi:hypothetical protein
MRCQTAAHTARCQHRCAIVNPTGCHPLRSLFVFVQGSGMDQKTKGAWLLAQSKSLDAFHTQTTARLENIHYAGKIGRLYNLLRREEDSEATLDASRVETICKLNDIDGPTRREGLRLLQDNGRIDIGSDGSVCVLGATTTGVLELAATVFDSHNPSSAEKAVLEISEKVADQPLLRTEATEFVSDTYRIGSRDADSLIDLCKATAIIDQESYSGLTVLFNSNTFRDGEYAVKVKRVLDGMKPEERSKFSEVREKMRAAGTLYEADVIAILGAELYRKVVSVGMFDRLEIHNPREAVGHITSPDDFHKYGRPYEDDPVDDAKALLASLTYGQTRSESTRGRVDLPVQLLTALLNGREVGGQYGVTAIAEDYKELEKRQVVDVRMVNGNRARMKLLKPDVGRLALSIVSGGAGSEEAVLLTKAAATNFKGPHETRTEVRAKKSNPMENKFVFEALDALRSGGYTR